MIMKSYFGQLSPQFFQLIIFFIKIIILFFYLLIHFVSYPILSCPTLSYTISINSVCIIQLKIDFSSLFMIGLSWHDPAPFQPEDSLGNALLCPTKIYVANLMPLVKSGLLKVIEIGKSREG